MLNRNRSYEAQVPYDRLGAGYQAIPWMIDVNPSRQRDGLPDRSEIRNIEFGSGELFGVYGPVRTGLKLGQRFTERQKPFVVQYKKTNSPLGDVFQNTVGVVAFPDSVRERLDATAPGQFDFLPIEIRNRKSGELVAQYWVWHIPYFCDCIDIEKTVAVHNQFAGSWGPERLGKEPLYLKRSSLPQGCAAWRDINFIGPIFMVDELAKCFDGVGLGPRVSGYKLKRVALSE